MVEQELQKLKVEPGKDEEKPLEDTSFDLSQGNEVVSLLDTVPEVETGQRVQFFPPRSVPRVLKQSRDERRDAVENTARVLNTARSLFAERGVEAVTMKDIAQAAGVGKGTLYRRFPHKGSLCQALMDENSRTFQDEVFSWFKVSRQEFQSLTRLKLFLSRLVSFTEANAALLKATFESGIMQGGPAFYCSPAYDWKRMTMVALLRAAMKAGVCRSDLDIYYLADALLAPLQDANLYLYQRQVLGFSTERIAVGLQQLLYGIVREEEAGE